MMISSGACGLGLLARACGRVLLVAVAGAAVFAALAGGAPAAVAGGWSLQLSPDPGTFSNQLWGVTATSSTNAWAVGNLSNATGFYRTLVEHWNGTAWKVQTSPTPGSSSSIGELQSVAATSRTNAWAVGYYADHE